MSAVKKCTATIDRSDAKQETQTAPEPCASAFSFGGGTMIAGKKIAIVGGGIGGLTAARVLAHKGAEVSVFEQAAEIAEVGAGLQVSPNGMRVLEAIGLGDALHSSLAVQVEAVVLKDRSDAQVLKFDLTQLEARGYYCVHRADLIALLLSGAREAGAKIRLLQEVKSAKTGKPASLIFNNGYRQEFDLIVGADGVHSAVRPVLEGARMPFFTGQVAWRATIPNVLGRKADVNVHMGSKRHLVSYPLRGGDLLNLVAVQEQRSWVAESWSHEDHPENLRESFASFGPEAQTMLAAVERVGFWGLFRHEVAKNWWGEGLALLGDAAHPTLPFMAQGAVQAMEDAWALGACLAQSEDMNEALAAYQRMRLKRVRRVVNAASRNAWKYHISFPPMRFAAHNALRLGSALAPRAMLRQFDWIYNYDVTREV